MKAVFAAFSVFLLIGCANTYTPPTSCNGEKSLILSVIQDPAGASLLLQLANLESLKGKAYSKESALAFFDTCERMLDQGWTYADLASYVGNTVEKLNGEYGAEIFIISGYLGLLDQPLPVSDCDRDLLKMHLKKQRAIVALVGE